MQKLLIIGDSGLIGRALIETISMDYRLYGLSRSQDVSGPIQHLSYDLTHQSLMPLLRDIEPDLVISCIRGPFDGQLHMHRELADYCEHRDTIVYFISTVNVFDGDMKGVRYEGDQVNAVSDYGQFKIACENLLVEKLQSRAVIIRLPMVFGYHSLRVDQIKEAYGSKTPILVYDNLLINTILDTDVALCIKEIIHRDLRSIFHLAAPDVVNHRDFYRMIVPKEQFLQIESMEGGQVHCMALGVKRVELLDFFKSNKDVATRIKTYLEAFYEEME
jgi:dTDP-4-dehydrorhamnose reductase